MARYNITPFNTGKFHEIKLAKNRYPTIEQNKEKQRLKKLKKKRRKGQLNVSDYHAQERRR